MCEKNRDPRLIIIYWGYNCMMFTWLFLGPNIIELFSNDIPRMIFRSNKNNFGIGIFTSNTTIYKVYKKGNKCLQQNNNMQIIYFIFCKTSHDQHKYMRRKSMMMVFIARKITSEYFCFAFILEMRRKDNRFKIFLQQHLFVTQFIL